MGRMGGRKHLLSSLSLQIIRATDRVAPSLIIHRSTPCAALPQRREHFSGEISQTLLWHGCPNCVNPQQTALYIYREKSYGPAKNRLPPSIEGVCFFFSGGKGHQTRWGCNQVGKQVTIFFFFFFFSSSSHDRGSRDKLGGRRSDLCAALHHQKLGKEKEKNKFVRFSPE